MKQKLARLSVLLFLLSSVAFIIMLFGNDTFLFAGAVLALVGLVMAIISERGLFRNIGLIGNGSVVMVVYILPFIVTTFFWNSP